MSESCTHEDRRHEAVPSRHRLRAMPSDGGIAPCATMKFHDGSRLDAGDVVDTYAVQDLDHPLHIDERVRSSTSPASSAST
jgi:hypothetical protein